MKPYNERLPLIDAAIKQGLKQEPGHYVFFGKGVARFYYGNNLCSYTQDFICTRDEFNQRKSQWYKLYEWCMKTEQVEFEDFITNSSMKEWAVACAEEHGFDWQDTLEKRPEPKEKDHE